MKLKFKQLLITAFIGIIALNILLTYKVMKPQPEHFKVVKQEHTQISESEYIISEELIMSKLQSKSQIVSLQQELDTKERWVDENWAGERETELKLHATYKLGLETKDILIKHIDSDTGTVFIKLGKPILISLEIPFDKLKFKKTQGFFRLAASEEEKQRFYKVTQKVIEKDIMKDKEVIDQANKNNQEVVKDIIMKIQGVNYIIFE